MSKELSVKVSFDTSNAEKKLDDLVKKINSINSTLNRVGTNNRVTQQLNRNTQQVSGIRNKVVAWAKAQSQVTANTRRTSSALGGIGSKLKMIASTYLGIMGARGAITASDTITSAKNKLNAINGGNSQLTQESMDKMYVAAQRSRSSYSDMMNNVSKTMTLAGGSFGNNIDNAIRFQEIMAKAYAVGGASDAEASSSMYQLVQALGSGVLQGDELRSVREGAPIAYKEIEKFAQGVLKTEESLKDLASQGKITSDMVVAAIMNAGDSIEEKFNDTAMTFAQAWDMIKNMALQAFRPVLEALNNLLGSDAGEMIMNGIGHALVFVANTLLWLGGIIGNVCSWFVDNWSWVQYIVIFAITVMIAYYGYLAGAAVVAAVKSAIAWTILHWKMVAIIAVIALLVTGIIWLANTMSSGTNFMIACLAVLAVAIIAIGLIINSTALLTIGIVLLVVTGIVALVAHCGEEVGRIIGYLVAGVYNLFVGLINGILQLAFSIIEPIVGIVEWILNVCQGGFDSFGDACANLIGQIISWFLSLGKVVTTIIDAIFGTNWSSGLSSLQEKVLSWGKNENAITISREAPALKRMEYGKAGDFGAALGLKAENKIQSFGTSLKDSIAGFDFSKLSKNNIFTGIGNAPGSYLPGLTDPTYGLDLTPTNDLLDGIGSDVGDMKDSMDLSNDDLEYLRRIADMEWRKEFTTAEIRVDMTNNNTVSSERDLDGIVEYLSDVLRSEMTNVAYGVHY